MQSKIGLVTITLNSESVIAGFINSVTNQNYLNYCLYIVDNNSTDNTLKKINELADKDKVVIIKNNFNNGVAGGNNQGILKALEDGCEYVILINNDTEFEKELISKLLYAAQNLKYSIAVPKMLYYNEPEIIWFGGGYLKRSSGYRNFHVGMGEKDEGQYSDREITYAPTCCALIHRSVFEDIGLMDEKYFVYFDDTDFWYRVMKHGKHKMLYINDIVFYHKVGSLTKSKNGTRHNFKFGEFAIKYTTRNRVYYLRKQKTPLSYFNLIWFWFRINLRFLFSGKYNVNINTWKLIQFSFWDGLKL
jgi:GT2 family glycosyltransferase